MSTTSAPGSTGPSSAMSAVAIAVGVLFVLGVGLATLIAVVLLPSAESSIGQGWPSITTGMIALPLPYVTLVVISTVLPFPLAWFGGRLGRGGWDEGRMTHRGWLMLACLWGAVVMFTWASSVMAVVLLSSRMPEFAQWALGSIVLSPAIPFVLAILNLFSGAASVLTGPAPVDAQGRLLPIRRHPAGQSYGGYVDMGGGGGGDGGGGGGGDGDAAKALLLLLIVVIAASVAILTVWLTARVSARRVGVRLSLRSAFFGRVPASVGGAGLRPPA